MSEADAREAVSRIADGGELDLAFDLHFQRLGVAAVWEVLAHPKKHIGQALADPIEGRSYGIGTAKLYQRPEGAFYIKSFAHGGCDYALRAPERASAEDMFDEVDAETLERIKQSRTKSRQPRPSPAAESTSVTRGLSAHPTS